jgi:hypothetical protein
MADRRHHLSFRTTGVRVIPVAIPLVLAGGAAFAFSRYRKAMREAEAAWGDIASRARQSTSAFDPPLVASLPEIAQRYFNHAIAPGTPLRTTVELEMRGTFLLGSKSEYQTYRMAARQILAPPSEFIWIPRMTSGLMRISGSDALIAGSAWTRFWLMALIPVANQRGSPDLIRSAVFRSAMEGIWVPASLLPENGVRWEQISSGKARVTVEKVDPPIVLEMTLASDGAVQQVVGQRWSNANPEQAFRLQPFGGTMEADATFEGYTIPTVIRVGNHFGTGDYLPFFQATITRAEFH